MFTPLGSVLRHVPPGAQLALCVHWTRHAMTVAGQLDAGAAAAFEGFARQVEAWAVGGSADIERVTVRGVRAAAADVGSWLDRASGHFSRLPDERRRFAHAVRKVVWGVRAACAEDAPADWAETADHVLRTIDRAKPPSKAALLRVPDFRTSAVVGLAESLWRALDPHVSAVLADALEEAGLPAGLVAPYRDEPGSLTRADWLFWHLGCERLGVAGPE